MTAKTAIPFALEESGTYVKYDGIEIRNDPLSARGVQIRFMLQGEEMFCVPFPGARLEYGDVLNVTGMDGMHKIQLSMQ